MHSMGQLCMCTSRDTSIEAHRGYPTSVRLQADITAILKGAAAQAVAAGVSPAEEQDLAAYVLQTALGADPGLISQVHLSVGLM
jgi:hypothetical protein